MKKVVIIGGGPGGYEAALVAGQLGADTTVVERDGLGGAAVLTDCVPSKSLIAMAEVMVTMKRAAGLGLHFTGDDVAGAIRVELDELNKRVLSLAQAQSDDISARLSLAGVTIIEGTGRIDGPRSVRVAHGDGQESVLEADIILVATGTTPRELPDAPCDGQRVLNWKQIYNLQQLPEKLIVVGSGVTGAEFASAFHALGASVVLVSSRTKVLPGEDQDAANVLQHAFETGGMEVMSQSRAKAVRNTGDGVLVTLEDGREVSGSHCLMAVGAIANSAGLGLEEQGVTLKQSGHIVVDRVSRTSVGNIYAAGDVTGVLPLASVAAIQGRTAMYHALGDAVAPLELSKISSNVFTSPEIATVGVTQQQVDTGEVRVASMLLPLRGNARAKMQGLTDGFVKLFCLPTTGIIVGGVVVAPYASELIQSIGLAVSNRITVDEYSSNATVYPSLTGSLGEAARRLHHSEVNYLTQ